MAKSESKTVGISDAGPIIHLDELAHLDLLSDFIPVIISKTVYSEIATHRPEALKHPEVIFNIRDVIYPPEAQLLVLSKALALDQGELESLILMQENPEAIFLTDDSAARLAGDGLGYKVHGTIGIILRAIRKKVITPGEVIELLRNIPEKTTLFLKPALLKDIIKKIKDEYITKKENEK